MNAPIDTRALVQGSEEWRMARVGYATTSEFASILAKGQGKMRAAYLRRLVGERLTGKPIESRSYGSWQEHLDRGQEQELFARASYEIATGFVVEQVGIIRHPTLMVSCSPDGLIDTDRGVEIKSVMPTVQVETILAGGYPSEHKAQIQGSLWITGRRLWDFCSFSPDLPEHLRTYVYTVERDEAYIKTLAIEVIAFLADVASTIEQLSKRAA